MSGVKLLMDPAPLASASVPAQTGIGTNAARVLAANPRRKRLVIQNTGTTVIKLSFGSTDPTATVYHVALRVCTGADDGSGGSISVDGYTGEVRALSSGSGGTFVITEFMTGNPDWNVAGDPGTAL